MFDDLLWADGQDNIGGTSQRHYFIPISWLYYIPPFPATPTTLSQLVTLSGNFYCNIGKKFLKLYTTLDTGGIVDKQVGESDGKSFESGFEFFFPGTRAEALGLITQFNNTRMLFIAVEGNGQKRVIGNALFPAEMSECEINTGLKTSDRKGMKIRVSSRGTRVAPIYNGSVPLTPAIGVPTDPTDPDLDA